MTGTEKSAIALLGLGKEVAAEVFKKLSQDEQVALADEMARLRVVRPEESTPILEEFQELMRNEPNIIRGGPEKMREFLDASVGSQKTIEILEKIRLKNDTTPFLYLEQFNSQDVYQLLRMESPQMISLILSYITPKKSSEVLKLFPGDIQTDIIQRMATSEEASETAIRSAEKIFYSRLQDLSKGGKRTMNSGSIESIVKILNASDKTVIDTVLSGLKDSTSSSWIADEIEKQMTTFKDIFLLTDRDLQKVLNGIEQRDLVIALRGVDTEISEKILKNKSKRAAKDIKDELEFMGPTRKKDVQDAQQKVVSEMKRLADGGEIVLSMGDDDLI
jgi:flagellar motor switch protein FliG